LLLPFPRGVLMASKTSASVAAIDQAPLRDSAGRGRPESVSQQYAPG
jgi:hypothetical protein